MPFFAIDFELNLVITITQIKKKKKIDECDFDI